MSIFVGFDSVVLMCAKSNTEKSLMTKESIDTQGRTDSILLKMQRGKK